MATPEDGIAAQVGNIERTYGKPISAWIDLVNTSGLSRHSDIVAMLKTGHGMTHGAAHRVALLARAAATPPPADPVAALYAGRSKAYGRSTTRSSRWSTASATTSPRCLRRATSACVAPGNSP